MPKNTMATSTVAPRTCPGHPTGRSVSPRGLGMAATSAADVLMQRRAWPSFVVPRPAKIGEASRQIAFAIAGTPSAKVLAEPPFAWAADAVVAPLRKPP